ncbi:hypothetical protein WJX73_008303 [Symbiochloris irregularis]|uniref:Uncharacterized protein n=1 Tax=Symbiochloris irregularis TaxID=706552 RepID=A0AAW1NX69_9CHLO
MPEQRDDETVKVSLGAASVAAITALLVGAAGSAAVHLTRTSKALKEEGIDAQARARAVPTAAKALLAATGSTVLAGSIAALAFYYSPLQAKDVIDIATIRKAFEGAKQQQARGADQPDRRTQGSH